MDKNAKSDSPQLTNFFSGRDQRRKEMDSGQEHLAQPEGCGGCACICSLEVDGHETATYSPKV